MIWEEEDPAESSSCCVVALASHRCNGALPSWVLLVNHQLVQRGGFDPSPCLPLIINNLRS